MTDRDRLEPLMTMVEVKGVRSLAKAAGLGPDQWTEIPGLLCTARIACAARLTRKEMKRNGTSQARALPLASAKVGLGPDAVLRRLREWGARTPAAVRGVKPDGWDRGTNGPHLNSQGPLR